MNADFQDYLQSVTNTYQLIQALHAPDSDVRRIAALKWYDILMV